jgi:nicotinic acid phosphoribosyltransferase
VDLTMDLYEVTMAASYVHRSMSGPATFSLFVRAHDPHVREARMTSWRFGTRRLWPATPLCSSR